MKARLGPGRLCGRIDGYKALELGVDADVRVRSKRDFLWSQDDCLIVSEKFKETVQVNKLHGVDFVPLKSARHFVVRPTLVVPMDVATCGIEFKGNRCDVCGRFSQTTGSPWMDSIQAPSDPFAMFSTVVRHEERTHNWANLYVSEQAAAILWEAGITGIDWESCRNTSRYRNSPSEH